MPDAPGGEADLTGEARIFVRHVAGVSAEDRLIDLYLEAHRQGVVAPRGGVSRFDRWLVRFARRGLIRARLADGYAALLLRNGLLRRKLVLILALLETGPAAHDSILAPAPAGVLSFAARAAVSGVAVLLGLAAGLVLFTPVRLALGTAAAPERPAAP